MKRGKTRLFYLILSFLLKLDPVSQENHVVAIIVIVSEFRSNLIFFPNHYVGSNSESDWKISEAYLGPCETSLM